MGFSALQRASRAFVAAALVALGALCFIAAPASASGATATRASGPPYPPELTVQSEMRLKADLVQASLENGPQLVFFGGSRSQRFDPAFAQRRLGLRSVNLAVSCARPEAAWAYANWIYKRWPDAQLRWVWGMQSGMLRDLDLDPALLQDPRFYGYFPDDLLASERAKLPGSVAQMPHFYGFLRNHYSTHGMLLRNVYDKRVAAGYTLAESLDAYIARMLHESRGASAQPVTRASTYFEQTIQLLNDHGTTPVIVIMPVHPRVLLVMRQHNMGAERELLRQYLAGLAATHKIAVVDFTRISTFDGKAGWFYDGVHITRENADRVIVALRAKAGQYLK